MLSLQGFSTHRQLLRGVCIPLTGQSVGVVPSQRLHLLISQVDVDELDLLIVESLGFVSNLRKYFKPTIARIKTNFIA
jgi:hypothetical protein